MARKQIAMLSQGTDSLQGLIIRVNVQMLQGRRRQAAQTCRRILRLSAENEATETGSSIIAAALLSLSELLYEWNEIDEAAQYATQEIAQSQQGGDVSVQVGSRLQLARVRQAQQQTTESSALIQQTMEIGKRLHLPSLETQLTMTQAHLALQQGDLARAERWVQHSDLPLTPSPDFSRKQEYLTLARIFAPARERASSAQLAESLTALCRRE